MGLDIYFYKTKKLGNKEYEIKTVEDVDCDLYFRKTNILMRYFNYDGNCEYKEITENDVNDLLEFCNIILDIEDEEEKIRTAKELLPTSSGFFWGSNDYDEYYFLKLKEVAEQFTRLKVDWENETVYMYAWY